MDLLNIRNLASERLHIFPDVHFRLGSSLVYENVSEFNPAFSDHLMRDVYSSRNASVRGIDLLRINNAKILMNGDFILWTKDGVADEQLPPWRSSERKFPRLTNLEARNEISGETVIIARYGAGTWGHWLGELLPKVALLESLFPRRFNYAIPSFCASLERPTFLQSLGFYGVGMDRVVILDDQHVYNITNCWAVTSIWSDHIMHPYMAETMRVDHRPHQIHTTSRKIALVRAQSDARSIINASEVLETLQKHGFEAINIGSLSFGEQVMLFQQASVIFSTLGSCLSGLVYAPLGVQVCSVAPHIFGDRFFYAMILNRNGYYADVRGNVVSEDPNIPHRSSFYVNPVRVEAALESLYKKRVILD